MKPVPCALCGYHAPDADCPHCGLAPLEPSLARRPVRGWSGVVDGLVAVPKGLAFLARTRGTKRWLVPPLVITLAILASALTAAFRWIDQWADESVPNDLAWRDAGWLQGLAEDWSWVHAVLAWLVVAGEWLAEFVLGALTSGPFSWFAGFLVASLVVWYCFSIAYEAVAGPFLDEVQARLEAGWFGSDPRSRLERPNDLATRTCLLVSLGASAVALGATLFVLAGSASNLWIAPAIVLPFVVSGLVHRRYGAWLAWVVRIEGGALWVGLQASLVTGVVLLVALPLYLIPAVGYFLYAGVTGFATAVALLDIATERRGWTLRQRARFVWTNLPTLIAFGTTAGMLLAVPFLGPIFMVPGASVGGLWLLCRLDKNFLRPDASRMEFPRGPGTVTGR